MYHNIKYNLINNIMINNYKSYLLNIIFYLNKNKFINNNINNSAIRNN
jgi:hypothetical protein